MPEISVIVPVYNVEKYLHACLDSILAQTFTDFELILVDDGSSDNSGKICDEYAEKDSRIRVFHQENQGQSAARNFGVAQAKAEWIHFVDSDDIIHPEMLSHLYSAVVSNNVKLSMCTYVSGEAVPIDFFAAVSNTEISVQKIDEEYTYTLLITNCLKYHSVWAKLIHKNILLKYPFENGRTREDSAVVCKWFSEAQIVACSEAPLYFYITNPNSTVNSAFNRKTLDILWAWNEQVKFYSALKYKKSRNFCLTWFLLDSCFLCNRMRKSPGNYTLSILKVKLCAVLRYFPNKKTVDRIIEAQELDRRYFYELLCPKTMGIYWVLKNIIHK